METISFVDLFQGIATLIASSGTAANLRRGLIPSFAVPGISVL
jgi:hypothetical protein